MSITAEECGELTQVCMKAVRFGLKDKTKERIIEELGDVQCMINLMLEHNILTKKELDASIEVKYNKLKTWSNLINETEV
jgi:NTP pyrophosphatase (non-canonical NTP hydrolase)